MSRIKEAIKVASNDDEKDRHSSSAEHHDG